ncbi:MAG: hypothetical protein LIO37_03905 [Clostridiales bacterium]|nr:hypothetical protein [Clostridiales bacterium]
MANELTANYNSVELHEDIDNDGDAEYSNSYEILPGTSDVKNPVATVNYTLDSYVFITMDENASDIVDFSIDTDVWTKLTGTDNVWYKLVTTEDSAAEVNGDMSTAKVTVYTQELNVLTNQSITYSKDLTNEDMLDSEGNIIDDLKIEFVAYIMQAEPYLSGNPGDEAAGALAAYLTMNGTTASAAYYEELGVEAMVNGKLYGSLGEAVTAALTAGGTTTVDVLVDTEVTDTLLFSLANSSAASAAITLDLNGNTITYMGDSSANTSYSSLIRVAENVTLTITGNGTIDGSAMSEGNELIWARGGNVIIESGTFILESTEESVVYASMPTDTNSVGTVKIYGGVFKNNGASYKYGSTLSALTLNVLNGNPGTITVYGGTFYGNNPANGDDNLGGTFVADGYSVKEVEVSTGEYAYVVYSGSSSVEVAGLDLENSLATAATAVSEGATEVSIVLDEGSYDLTGTTTAIPAGTTITGAGTDETTLTVDCSTNSGDGYTISSENVTLSDLSITCTNMGTGYANSVLNITASGTVLDNVNITGGTQATYTSSIYINGGNDEDFTFTIKNSTIDNSSKAPFRALFVENIAGKLYIENCTPDAVYPINVMSASTTAEVYFTDCTIHGWTSYTANVKQVIFTNCTFSKGSGANTYDNVAAYTDTVFTNCTFDSSFVLYAQTTGFSWTLNSCTKNGTAVTADNFKTLFPDDSDVWNECTCTVDGTTVEAD